MFDEPTDRRIASYLAGQASPQEAAELEAWIAADPARAAYVDELRRTWEAAGAAAPQWSSAAAWETVRARIEQGAPEVERVPELKVVRSQAPARRAPSFTVPGGSPLVRIAAVVTLLLGSGAVWWATVRQGATGPTPVEAPAPMREVATRPGERAEIYLSDGTRVLLGVGSKLRFAAPLAKDTRDVYLEGEALFEVTHDEEWPFRVHTTHGIAEDLGTTFNVRAYAADSSVTVVVAEGKVALREAMEQTSTSTPPEALLTPGQLGHLEANGTITVRRDVDVDRYFAWTEGRLVFDNTPLRDVVAELHRWYDLDFRLADPALGDRRLTASFTGESAEQMVSYIALTLGLRHDRQDRTVTFHPGPRR